MSAIDPVLESLKERGWREVAAIDSALADGRLTEEGWHEAAANLIRPAYLAAGNPYGQAGHSGDARTWEASRGIIAEAIHKSGSFLDVGCASGILMETVTAWCARRNLHIEPYGLEIVPEFVELARKRLPQWADRIMQGNIRSWQPEHARFDFALIRPEYAPPTRRADLVQHVLTNVLKTDGRLIVFVGSEEKESRRAEAMMATPVSGRIEIEHPQDTRLVRRLFWIDK